MLTLRKGQYVARLAGTAVDVGRAQRLCYLAFIETRGASGRPDGLEADAFDSLCRHVLVEEVRSGTLVCCFRLLPLRGGAEIGPDTLARFYSIHMLILPGAIFALIGLHLYLVIRLGVRSPPGSKTAAGAPWIEEEEEEEALRKGLVQPAPRGGAAK